MVRGDLRGGLVFAISGTLLFLVSPPRYGDTTLLEELLGVRMSGLTELAIAGVGVALSVALLVYRRLPSDPDDRGWIPEE